MIPQCGMYSSLLAGNKRGQLSEFNQSALKLSIDHIGMGAEGTFSSCLDISNPILVNVQKK